MSENRGQFSSGVILGAALSAAGITVLASLAAAVRTANGLWTFESPQMGALLFVGFTQILWVAPASLVLLAKERTQTLKGMLIVAGVLVSLNVAWLGVFILGASYTISRLRPH